MEAAARHPHPPRDPTLNFAGVRVLASHWTPPLGGCVPGTVASWRRARGRRPQGSLPRAPPRRLSPRKSKSASDLQQPRNRTCGRRAQAPPGARGGGRGGGRAPTRMRRNGARWRVAGAAGAAGALGGGAQAGAAEFKRVLSPSPSFVCSSALPPPCARAGPAQSHAAPASPPARKRRGPRRPGASRALARARRAGPPGASFLLF